METLSINTKSFASTPFLHMPGEWANLNAHHITYKALFYCVHPLLLQGDGSGKELEGGC